MTAEGEVLQNPLDQMKAELNRVSHNRGLISPMVVTSIGEMGMIQVLAIALAAFVMEYFMGKPGLMIVFERVPLLGDYLLPLLQFVSLFLKLEILPRLIWIYINSEFERSPYSNLCSFIILLNFSLIDICTFWIDEGQSVYLSIDVSQKKYCHQKMRREIVV